MKVKEEILLDKIIYLINALVSPKRILLFGSRGKGSSRDGSDFDIAIDSDKIEKSVVRNLKENIEEIAGLYSVDIVFLNEVEDGFRKIILDTGKVIYEK
ncbi:MAG: nucleotidyltransferase domain-containing protein [Bacteroidota bacterium]